jgi:hypothetical protein
MELRAEGIGGEFFLERVVSQKFGSSAPDARKRSKRSRRRGGFEKIATR